MLKIKKIVRWFLVWRMLLFIPLLIGFFFLPYKQNSEFTNIWNYTQAYFPVSNFLIYPWANFDGVHYLSIAGRGYTFDGRFFPLYPLLIHIFSFFDESYFGGVQFFIGFLISNLSFFLGLILFYKLLRLDYNEKIANRTILYFLIFPTSFFFVTLYAEGLFIFLLVYTFYLARQNKWWLSGLTGFLLTLTRPVGIVIFPVLLYEFIKAGFYRKLSDLIPFFLIPIGLILYGYYCLKKWGDALYFIHAQGGLSNGRSSESIIFFPQTLFRYSKILFGTYPNYFEWWIALLELATFFFISFMIYFAWKKGIRSSYILFSLLAFLLPASTGTFSGLPRYSAILFPVFIRIALLKNRLLRYSYTLISTALLFILLILFSRGYYVS